MSFRQGDECFLAAVLLDPALTLVEAKPPVVCAIDLADMQSIS